MPNALSKETSPYLLQHADNPVDWHAWSEQSLRLAREQDKPILLSIGYSACHWCHVMAHESFQDEATAALMNSLFVNIKVDREERPDLDRIYQTAHQLVAQAPGGWPLTVFLTPDEQIPIFSGTYFPRELFKQVLTRVKDYFHGHGSEVRAQASALRQALTSLEHSAGTDGGSGLTLAPLKRAVDGLKSSFDEDHGGFGDAPKFPHPTHIDSLLAAWRRSAEASEPDLQSLYMATLTLTRMAERGLYDHLGGGFFRYSVDRSWSIPHFEKMLYDNAALVSVYSDAYAATGEPLFARVAAETAEWVIRDMQLPHGGYCATLDADSEGEEGRFYLWTPAQARELLDDEELAIAAEHLGLAREPNFEGKAWHLQAHAPMEEISGTFGGRPGERLAAARCKLLAAREQRPRPGRDEKILVSWNGLAIAGLARAARHLNRADLAGSATRAADFVRRQLWTEGRLRACHKDGRARFTAYLDDYAFLADGLLELLQYRWRTCDLTLACELADVILEQFEDSEGGFFFTAHDHETLIHRPKPMADEATPAGNGVAVRVLLWLGHLIGEQRYLQAASRALRAAWPLIERYPEAHDSLLQGLELAMEPPELVVIRGGSAGGDPEPWLRYANAGYHPKRKAFAIPGDEDGLPGFLAERRPRDGVVAYVCLGTECRAPVASLEELTAALAAA